jgi:uncharacterized membrane protein
MFQFFDSRFKERSAQRQALAAWRNENLLSVAPFLLAWLHTEPERSDWLRWTERLLLILGAILVCGGIGFVLVFTLEEQDVLTKFRLLLGTLTLLAGFAAWRPAGDKIGKAALGGAQLTIGALLAVIGQVYQTGAEAWQLFAIWAILASLWARAARSAPHWWLVVIVANLGLQDYVSTRQGLLNILESATSSPSQAAIQWLLAATALQLALWFLLCKGAPSLGFRGKGGSRILGAQACCYAFIWGLAGLLNPHAWTIDFFFAGLLLCGVGAWFCLRAFDLAMLILTCLTGIALAVAGVGKISLVLGHAEYNRFLVQGPLIIILAAIAAKWLWHIQHQHRREHP